MPDLPDVPAGIWWRFERYEIRNGCICPAPSARLEQYDPWESYRNARAKRGEGEPPYRSLLALLNDLTFRPATADNWNVFVPTPESEEQLLAWCAEYGLLGVLLQRAQMVVLAPRWESGPRGSMLDGDGHRVLHPTLRRYLRTSTGWLLNSTTSLFRVGGHLKIDAPEDEGQLVAEEHVPPDWPRPGVLLRDLHEPGWDQEPLSKTWARFFPDAPENERDTCHYPHPLSEVFWRVYAEPIEAFVRGAVALRDAVAGAEGKDPPPERSHVLYGRSHLWGLAPLHHLVEAVSPTLEKARDGSFRQRWASPSLLASYGMMVLLDLAEHRRVLNCEVCGRVFLAGAYQARYCSVKCRRTAQKRAYRAKRRETEPRS